MYLSIMVIMIIVIVKIILLTRRSDGKKKRIRWFYRWMYIYIHVIFFFMWWQPRKKVCMKTFFGMGTRCALCTSTKKWNESETLIWTGVVVRVDCVESRRNTRIKNKEGSRKIEERNCMHWRVGILTVWEYRSEKMYEFFCMKKEESESCVYTRIRFLFCLSKIFMDIKKRGKNW